MTLTQSGTTLAEIINKAIDDNVITASEYEEIMSAANEDGKIDHHERILLRELKNLIAERIVVRAAG